MRRHPDAEKTGSFRLSFNGVLSNPINFGATASQVQTVLNGLSSIGGAGGSVTVTRNNVETTTQNGPGLARHRLRLHDYLWRNAGQRR